LAQKIDNSTWSLEPKIEDQTCDAVLLLGSGKLSRHLHFYFSQQLKIPVVMLSWRDCVKQSENFSFDQNGRSLTYADGVQHKFNTQKFSLCFLLGKDGELFDQFQWLTNKGARLPLVHCSGRVVISGVSAWHPLGSFSEYLFPLEDYSRIPFIGDELACPLSQLMPKLRNQSFIVPRADRELYHSLCVFSSNLSAILWAHVLKRAEDEMKLPKELFEFLLRSSGSNVLKAGHGGVTGPIARGDRVSIDRNLAALNSSSERDVYRAVARLFNEDLKLEAQEFSHVDQ